LLPGAFVARFFISGIPEDQAITEDGTIASLVVNYEVDYVNQSVTCTMKAGGAETAYKAIYQGPTLGCTLVGGGMSEYEIRSQDHGHQTPIPLRNTTTSWPLGDGDAVPIPPDVNAQCLHDVIDEDFARPSFNTRSTVVIYKGQMIYERYGRSITKRSPLMSWSMAKSITSTLMGILHKEGRVNIDHRADVDAWANDRRQNITYRNLLNMQSGLRWGEAIDLFICLYRFVDCGTYYQDQRLLFTPGTRFNYATAESYLLAQVMEQKVRGQSDVNFFDWHREVLFRRMGMDNAVFEVTPFEYLAGGSLAYLNARDWARYGYLYMMRGNWFGDQIVDGSWVDFTCSPTPVYPYYGALWWLHELYIDPRSCMCEGFRRQNVFVLPSKNLVIVRNAMPHLGVAWLWSRPEYLERITRCFP